MPSLVSCGARNPPRAVDEASESPPRKKFKYSLKLKPKLKKADLKINRNEDNGYQSCDEDNCLPAKVEENETLVGSTEIQVDNHNHNDNVLELKPLVPPLPYSGLANLGNTCYLNAVLQVLRYCPDFCQSLANLDKLYSEKRMADRHAEDDDTVSSEKQSPPNIIHSIHKLMCEMVSAEANYNKNGMEAEQVKNRAGYTTLAVQPGSFVREFSGLCPMFSGYQQHDAQEFLRSFLSIVEDDTTGLTKDNSDTERPNSKENNQNTSSNGASDSKVRGGCKYPNGLVTQTVAENTEMTLTSGNTKSEDVCTGATNDKRCHMMSGLDKSVTPSKVSQNYQCTKCSSNSNPNLVQRLFEGKLQLQTRCLTCEVVRTRNESFQDISVPVQNTNKKGHEMMETENMPEFSDSGDESSEKDLNLSWAISKFASVEKLQGDNKYFCDNCKTFTEAEISTYFDELPQVLTIHLKRFQTSYGSSLYASNMITKVTRSLQTPQQLSLSDWCNQPVTRQSATYQLFGVVMHSGMSSCSGHYLSYVNTNIVNMGGETEQLDGCKCSNQDLPVCTCPVVSEDSGTSKNRGLEDQNEDNSVDEEPQLPVPTRGIKWYFKPVPKQKDRTVEPDESPKTDNCAPQGSDGSTVSQSTASLENGCPIHKHSTMPTAQQSTTDCFTNINDKCTTESNCETSKKNWLKFDDAEVQEITEKDMEDILSPSSSCYSTPYLLFYFKL